MELNMGRPSSFRTSRRSVLLMGLASTALMACSSPSLAVGRAVSVDVVDRDTGQVLTVYTHHGRHYIAGRPGARYAIRITNQTGGRVLAVTAVDGVNVVSGQTASWGQTGYVFEPWQSYELTGWRKSDEQVAAFEFTSLPDSYAARTGRPLDVGVIGVAVFRERYQPPVPLPSVGALESRDAAGAAAPASPAPEPSGRAQQAPGVQGKALAERADAARSRLGTGHGEREQSPVSRTQFERATSTPSEVISLQYDRYENLVAAGIIAPEPIGRPRPFPQSRDTAGYVPDPPRY
jgi:hypothetical protein